MNTRSQWNTLQSALIGLHEDFLAAANEGSGSDPSGWEASLLSPQTQIETKALALDALESGFESARVTEAAALLAQNGQVVTPNLLATNEQAVNNLYLTNALWTNAPVSAIVLDELKIIADQCPDWGGFAVYEARSLYAQRKPGTAWDDKVICSPAQERGQYQSKALKAAVKLQVMPNPASDILLVSNLKGSITKMTTFRFYNAQGQLVLEKELDMESNSTNISLDGLIEGIYFYQISIPGSISESGKIMIKH